MTGLKFGVILLPLMIIGMVLRQKGPVNIFLKLGAVSEQTARRAPEMTLREKYLLPDTVKRGALVKLEDGRYYVNEPVVRRSRRRIMALIVLMTLTAAVLGGWFVIDAMPSTPDTSSDRPSPALTEDGA